MFEREQYFLKQINEIEVVEYSIFSNELEYVNVVDNHHNRMIIDSALNNYFNFMRTWADKPTVSSDKIMDEYSNGESIDISGIIYNKLPQRNSEIWFHADTGFQLKTKEV